jgi:DNA-binding MarR family transcriptional regulator
MKHLEQPSQTSTATADESPRGDCIIALLEVARRVQERLEGALEGAGLSSAKYAALDALVRAAEPLALSDLAGCLGCVRSNVTQLVDRLEGDGLVRRAADPADRRSIRAEVTELGRERHAAGAEAAHRLRLEAEARLEPAERDLLRRVLCSLR